MNFLIKFAFRIGSLVNVNRPTRFEPSQIHDIRNKIILLKADGIERLDIQAVPFPIEGIAIAVTE